MMPLLLPARTTLAPLVPTSTASTNRSATCPLPDGLGRPDRAGEDLQEHVVLHARPDRHPDVAAAEAMRGDRAQQEQPLAFGEVGDLGAGAPGGRHIHEDEVALRGERPHVWQSLEAREDPVAPGADVD